MQYLFSLIALFPALIWAISPIIYADILKKNETLKVNFYRMLFASIALSIPFFIFGFNEGIFYAIASGLLTLAIGDSLYLLSISRIGASIAAPLSYTYVFFSQIAASFLGEKITPIYFVSSLLIIAGVSLLARGNGKQLRLGGVLLALACATFWTLGQSMIKLATIEEMNPISIAFARTSSACVTLSILAFIRNGNLRLNINRRQLSFFGSIAIADLALGSSIFILSIGLAGLALTIIITSASPLFTQIIAKVSGRENPTMMDFIGGGLIVLALIFAFIF